MGSRKQENECGYGVCKQRTGNAGGEIGCEEPGREEAKTTVSSQNLSRQAEKGTPSRPALGQTEAHTLSQKMRQSVFRHHHALSTRHEQAPPSYRVKSGRKAGMPAEGRSSRVKEGRGGLRGVGSWWSVRACGRAAPVSPRVDAVQHARVRVARLRGNDAEKARETSAGAKSSRKGREAEGERIVASSDVGMLV
eukprot:3715820-Pleurochrysis_carterae.AAC.1